VISDLLGSDTNGPLDHPRGAAAPSSSQTSNPSSITIQVVLAQEQIPSRCTTPISWLLLTTLPVNSFDQAVDVCAVQLPLLIERYHYVLKSGCHLEQLQLETAERIESALATYCIVGWRLLWLTYERAINLISCVIRFYKPTSGRRFIVPFTLNDSPTTPPSLRQAVHWIAHLAVS
jgi:hypothetical protein